MQNKLHLVAAAVALAAFGSANAYTPVSNSATGGSLALTVFNVDTKAAYVRDLLVTLNGFLPNSVTTGAGDGGVTGNKTPDSGLFIDKSSAGFGSFAGGVDTNWTTFLSQNTDTSKLRWIVYAGDQTTVAGTSNVSRFMATSKGTPTNTVTNAGVTNSAQQIFAQDNALFTGLNTGNTSTLSTGVNGVVEGGLGQGTGTLGLLGDSLNVYYYKRSVGTLANSTTAVRTLYDNVAGPANFTLGLNGDLSYSVTAVPEPETVLLFGAGLFAVMGAARRRKQAAAV